MKYEVTFQVLANYTIVVNASSEKEAKELARRQYDMAHLGDFEYVDELDVHTDLIKPDNEYSINALNN